MEDFALRPHRGVIGKNKGREIYKYYFEFLNVHLVCSKDFMKNTASLHFLCIYACNVGLTNMQPVLLQHPLSIFY